MFDNQTQPKYQIMAANIFKTLKCNLPIKEIVSNRYLICADICNSGRYMIKNSIFRKLLLLLLLLKFILRVNSSDS